MQGHDQAGLDTAAHLSMEVLPQPLPARASHKGCVTPAFGDLRSSTKPSSRSHPHRFQRSGPCLSEKPLPRLYAGITGGAGVHARRRLRRGGC